MRNPFTPNFGQVPVQMAGRTELIAALSYALDNAPGDPYLTTIIVGARGTGKTALLSYIASEATARGWIAANVPCIPGMLEDIYQQALNSSSHLIDGKGPQRRLKGASGGLIIGGTGVQLGAEWQNPDAERDNWRTRMSRLLDELAEQEAGLLITVDEVDPSLDEMIQLAAVYQMFVREERRCALLMAGLPHRVSALISNQSVSFLRRASQYYLRGISDLEVADALSRTVEIGGKTISDEATELATHAIGGFPFMMQLVGYRSWMACADRAEISPDDVARGIALAENDMKTRVLKATLDELSERDLQFLQNMLEDEGASEVSDIANRFGKSSSYVSGYRKRLLEHGVIESAGRSRVKFALPMLREYLPEYLEVQT